MKQEKLVKFLDKQRKKIDEAKWAEGEKLCRDPGQAFVIEWIKDNAKKFRKDFTNEELNEAMSEIADMKKDLANSIVDINKLKKYLEDIQDKIDMAKETLHGEGND